MTSLSPVSPDSIHYSHDFRTHPSKALNFCFERVRVHSDAIGRFAQQIARILTHPIPGGDESSLFLRFVGRADAIARAIILALPAFASTCLLVLPYYVLEKTRPNISVIQPSQETPPPQHTQVLSFNTLLMPNFACTGNHIEGAISRAHAIADTLLAMEDPPTLIALQEVFQVGATEVLINRLKGRWPYIIHSVNPQPFCLSSGMLNLSQHPLSTPPEFTPFRSLVGDDALSGKGFLRFSIDTDEGPAIIYNCHTQSGESDERQLARGDNLRQLLDSIEQDAASSDYPIFVVGDLNVDRRNEKSPFVTSFFSNFEDSCAGQTESDSSLWKIHRADSQWGTARWTAEDGRLEGERIDYILRYRREEDSDASRLQGHITDLFKRNSDHLAVTARYQP